VTILKAEGIRKTYYGGEAPVEAVRGVDLHLESGDFVAVMGPSGCGKSTLLHICGAMDRPTAGQLTLDGVEVAGLDEEELTRLRRDRVGFVFQFFNLLPTLTVSENIALPLLLAGRRPADAARCARMLAERLGMGPRLRHYPQQLSGGEMQRAAIARAVIHQPALLIADEPTGNLDSVNGRRIVTLLSELNQKTGVGILLATHSSETASFASRILHMRDGRIDGAQDIAGVPDAPEHPGAHSV